VFKLCIERSMEAEAEFLSVLSSNEVDMLGDFLGRLAKYDPSPRQVKADDGRRGEFSSDKGVS
jgi:hypothetical protein